MGPLASSTGYTSLVSQRLFEHEVSDSGFEVPINYRDRRKIERSMRTHHHPDPARDCKDRPEGEARDHRLFDARQPQVGVMAQGKQRGGEQDDGYFCAGPGPEKLAEPFEQEPSENGLFSEARADDHREHQSGECSPVSYHVMVGGIDFGGAQQRHHDRLH